jgi:hypothetical protein
LTDLVCEYVKWQDGLVHSGIKTAAEWFIKNLVPDLIKYAEIHQCRNLSLVGHSLGGGTATVLAMMMVEHMDKFPLHPDGSKMVMHAYGFAAPPIVSLNLGKRYKDYISTYIFEDDPIPRLSYGHMMDLKNMILCANESEKYGPSAWSAVRLYTCCCCCCVCPFCFLTLISSFGPDQFRLAFQTGTLSRNLIPSHYVGMP